MSHTGSYVIDANVRTGEDLDLDELLTDDSPERSDFQTEIYEKAAELSYFSVDQPENAADGFTSGGYNILKGIISGPAIIATAPFACAYEEASQAETMIGSAGNGALGFCHGLMRGLFGGPALMATGLGTGLEQMRKGLFDPQPAPGQGVNLQENFDHLLDTKVSNLVFNKPPEDFEEEVGFMIDEGLIESVRYDEEGAEKPIRYQYFLSEKPENIFEGMVTAQYNVMKGVFAGVTLLVCAPPRDMVNGYMDTTEDSEMSRLGGAARGLASGLLRGSVGSVIMISGGFVHGAHQLAGGVLALQNIPRSASAAAHDASRLASDPLHTILLQKGYGLEEFLVREKNNQINAHFQEEIGRNLDNDEFAEAASDLPPLLTKRALQEASRVREQEDRKETDLDLDEAEKIGMRKSIEHLEWSIKELQAAGNATGAVSDSPRK